MNRFGNSETYTDSWTDSTTPYIANERDIYLKLELDVEAFTKFKEERGLPAEMTMKEFYETNREGQIYENDSPDKLPGEISRHSWGPD